MQRRQFVAATAVGVTGLAGCLGDGGTTGDGYAPESTTEDVPPPGADPDSFERLDRDGTEVPLVPLDVAYDWYRRRDARFADARGRRQFEAVHVAGAVLSTAPDGLDDDPVDDWARDERIVTYCGCPHHLSSMRAASLIESGYESVYAIDEGFVPWLERGYPVDGEDADEYAAASWSIAGAVDPSHADDLAWVRHEPTGQREVAPIGADGTFELTVRFLDVDDDTPVDLETPAFSVTEPLGALAATTVTGP